MQLLRSAVARASKDPSPVLLIGETGTGKELIGAEIHRLAFELMNVIHAGADEDMHLLVEQLGDVGDLVDEVRPELAGLGVVLQDIGLSDPHVDAAQEHHVLDVLLSPLAHHGQHAQSVTIVENVGDVLDDGQVGAARTSGHDRHHVLVHARAIALAFRPFHIGIVELALEPELRGESAPARAAQLLASPRRRAAHQHYGAPLVHVLGGQPHRIGIPPQFRKRPTIAV